MYMPGVRTLLFKFPFERSAQHNATNPSNTLYERT